MSKVLSAGWGIGLQVAIVCAGLGVVAFLTGGPSGISQATIWVVFGLFAISVDFMWGYCGLLSFGQAAFFGLGAYAYAWLGTDVVHLNMHGLGSLLGLLAALALPALLALLLGYFLFYGKVVGAFFTIVTLALSFLMNSLGQGLSGTFGGYTGIPDVPGLFIRVGSFSWQTGDALSNFIFVSVVTVLVTVGARFVLSTRFGVSVDGVRDNETRLLFLGQNTATTKLIVFVMASAVAGLAGALYASQANFVSSDLMGTLLSTEVVVWVAVGGRRTLLGGLLGAIIVRGVGFWLSGVAIEYWQLLLGGLFIAVVLAGSSGLLGFAKWVADRTSRRPAPLYREGGP